MENFELCINFAQCIINSKIHEPKCSEMLRARGRLTVLGSWLMLINLAHWGGKRKTCNWGLFLSE